MNALRMHKLRGVGVAVITVLMLSFGCGHDNTKPDKGETFVSRADIVASGGQWPLKPQQGFVSCGGRATGFRPSGSDIVYALNDWAAIDNRHDYGNIRDITTSEFDGMYRDALQALVKRADIVCHQSGSQPA